MMVTKRLMVMKTQFDYISKRVSSGNMVRVIGSIWVFVCNYLLFVSGFITRYILIRFEELDDQFDSNREEQEMVLDYSIRRIKDCDENRAETGDCSGYMEEPKSMSFTVQEFYADSGSSKFSDYQVPIKAAEEDDDDTDHENSVDYNEILEALENELVIDRNILDDFSTGKVSDGKIEPHEVEEDSFSIDFDSKREPVSPRKDQEVGSLNYQFLIYRNVAQYEDEGLKPQISVFRYNEEDHDLLDPSIQDGKAVSFSDHCDDHDSSDDEYIELLEPQLRSYTQQLDQVEEKGKEKVELVQDGTQDTSLLCVKSNLPKSS